MRGSGGVGNCRLEMDNAGEWHLPESVVLQGLSAKADLFQIPPIRLICVVMQADISNVVKVECLGCHLIMHSDDFTSKVTMR